MLASLDFTIRYTECLRLVIDWAKTWAWVTSSSLKQTWQHAMQQQYPNLELRFVDSARELGYTIHYNRKQSRHCQKSRHADALDRLDRIKRLHAPIQLKAQLAQHALVKALHSTENYVVGQHWLIELRQHMSRAVVHHRKNTNSYLAMLLLSDRMQDPELYLIVQSVRAVRSILWNSTREYRDSFLHFASRHNADHRSVHGPAGALTYNLARLSWKIDRRGSIQTDSILTLHLLEDPLPDLVRNLKLAWERHALQCCIVRPDLGTLPELDTINMVKLFKSLDHDRQRILAYSLTGSNMFASQTRHFTDSDGLCPLCQQLDNAEHRVLHCEALADVRVNHANHVSVLSEQDRCHFALPIIVLPKDLSYRHYMGQRIPEPTFNEEVLTTFFRQVEQGTRPVLYTDGSCLHPTMPYHRAAAFAAVLYVPDREPVDIIREFAATSKPPHEFQVMLVGQCQGYQSIPRAELQAVLAVSELEQQVDIHTDSKYVVDLKTKLSSMLSENSFHKISNFDLAQRLWKVIQPRYLHLHKVKAHNFDPASNDHALQLHHIGNTAADIAAKLAMLHHPLGTTREERDDHLQQQQFFQDACSYRYELHCQRANKINAKRDPTADAHTTHEHSSDLFRKLQLYTLDNPWNRTVQQHHEERMQSCLWGTAYSIAILRWLQYIQWPTSPFADDNPGVTWYELCISFQLVSGLGININAGTTKTFRPRCLPWNDMDIPFQQQVFAFERCFTQIHSLLDWSMPTGRKQHCASIRMLGAAAAKPGLAGRPIFPEQSRVEHLLRDHFLDITTTGLTGPPTFPQITPWFQTTEHPTDVNDMEDEWLSRRQKYRRARQRRVQP